MGRNKIKIEKKAENQLLATYNKRKNGVAKKTKELAILCEIDALLLSISPRGKFDLVLGSNSNLEDVIDKYCKLSSKERHESRLENIEILKKAFKGDPDHEVDVQKLMNHGVSGNSQEAIQGQQSDEILQSFLDSLVDLDYLPMIASVGELSQMEVALENLIYLNRQKKMSMLEERAKATAFQQLNPQVAMNHPGPQNGNPMNQGTNLIQSNMYLTDSNIVPTVPNVTDLTEGHLRNISLRESTRNSVRISEPPMVALESNGNFVIVSDPPVAAPESDGNFVMVSDPLVAASPNHWKDCFNWEADACDFGN